MGKLGHEDAQEEAEHAEKLARENALDKVAAKEALEMGQGGRRTGDKAQQERTSEIKENRKEVEEQAAGAAKAALKKASKGKSPEKVWRMGLHIGCRPRWNL